LKKEVVELKGTRKTLNEELMIGREEVQNSRTRMENLKNYSQAFYSEYEESMSLTKTIGDKLFLTMSNLYFFNLSRGIQVDFSESFLDGQVLYFIDVFLIRVVLAISLVYLAQEPDTEM
jgi:hypothetical protein